MIFLLFLFLSQALPELTLLNSNETGITISYSLPPISIEDIKQIENAAYPDKSGVPCLPEIYVYVAIPLGSEIRVYVEEANIKEKRQMDILPVPEVHEWGYEYKKDPSIYEKDILYPPELVSIKERGFIRGQEFVMLRLQPVRYNPKEGIATIYDRIKIRVNFSGGKRGERIKDPYFEDIFKEVFINYEEARDWRKRPAKGRVKNNNNPWVKIGVKEKGIYRITYNDLRNIGIDPDFINPISFRLFTQGGRMEIPADDTLKEVPVYITDDAIYFYATSTDGYKKNGTTYLNIFTDMNVYWLTYGDIGRRDSISGNLGAISPIIPQNFRDTIHIEEDHICPAKSGRGWAWFELKKVYVPPRSYTIPFELPNLVNSQGEGRFAVYGYTKDRYGLNMPHSIRFHINGESITEDTWVGGNSLSPHSIVTDISNINEGENELTVELWAGPDADTIDWIYFDYLEIIPQLSFDAYNGELQFKADEGDTVEFHLSGFEDLPVIFNIEDELSPVRVTDIKYEGDEVVFQSTKKGPYYAATTFKSPISITVKDPYNIKNINGHTVDYVIITTKEFKYAAQELARYREERDGVSALVVFIDDIYDNFSFGMENPYGVKNFLKFAYDNWNTSYVLLLGSGTYDYRSGITKNRLPPWEEGYHIGEFGLSPLENPCYDNWFAMVCGDDNRPDIIIARITAESKDDARIAVKKVIDYEKSFGPWRSRILLSADDEYGAKSPSEQCHTEHAEYLNSITPPSYDVFKVYLIDYPPSEQGFRGNKGMIEYISKGIYYGVYMGHGNYKQLAHENIWTSPKDVYALSNSKKYTIFFYGSCGVAAYDRPYTRSTADLMQIIEDKGAIATIAATRSTYPSDNTSMSIPLYTNIVVDPKMRVGDAFFLSLYIGNPKKYILFGDPLTDMSCYRNNEIHLVSDSLSGGTITEVSGESGDIEEGYVYITAYCAENKWIYNWARHEKRVWDGPPDPSNEIAYSNLGGVIFRGSNTFGDSTFTVSFFIPTGLDSGVGKVTGYLWDNERDGRMGKGIWITGRDTTIQDTIGPQIEVFVNGKKMPKSVKVSKKFTMSATIQDTSGIMLQEGKGIRLEIKDGPYYHLEDRFEYNIGSSMKGELVTEVESQTMYSTDTLTLIVRDNVGNESNLQFWVEKTFGDEIVLENPINYPNPVKGKKTKIEFYSSKVGIGIIRIFTISGRLIKTLHIYNVREGINSKEWDTRDEFGDMLGNGIYIYKIEVRCTGSESSENTASCIGKMMIMR